MVCLFTIVKFLRLIYLFEWLVYWVHKLFHVRVRWSIYGTGIYVMSVRPSLRRTLS